MKLNPKFWQDATIIFLVGILCLIVNDFIPRFFPNDYLLTSAMAFFLIVAFIRWKE